MNPGPLQKQRRLAVRFEVWMTMIVVQTVKALHLARLLPVRRSHVNLHEFRPLAHNSSWGPSSCGMSIEKNVSSDEKVLSSILFSIYNAKTTHTDVLTFFLFPIFIGSNFLSGQFLTKSLGSTLSSPIHTSFLSHLLLRIFFSLLKSSILCSERPLASNHMASQCLIYTDCQNGTSYLLFSHVMEDEAAVGGVLKLLNLHQVVDFSPGYNMLLKASKTK
jgi:hypothetical protein